MIMNEKKIIPIVFAIDNNYAPMLHVTIRSIIAHASADYDYHIHIMYENLSAEYQRSLQSMQTANVQIQFDFVGDTVKKYANVMHYKYYGSNAIYYRVFIPEIFTQYDKVIYLDSDVVLNADISEFYNTQLGDKFVAGALCEIVNGMPVFINYAKKFLGIGNDQPCYFNSGVLLMNCAKMREVHFIDKFFALANEYKLEVCPDQDYYNLLCHGKSVILPNIWNKMPITGSKEKLAELKLVHYNVFGKPWQQKGVLYEELFWEHAKNTPMYEKLLSMREQFKGADVGGEKVNTLAELATELANRGDNILAKIKQRYH